jgi:hypothetical protein
MPSVCAARSARTTSVTIITATSGIGRSTRSKICRSDAPSISSVTNHVQSVSSLE